MLIFQSTKWSLSPTTTNILEQLLKYTITLMYTNGTPLNCYLLVLAHSIFHK